MQLIQHCLEQWNGGFDYECSTFEGHGVDGSIRAVLQTFPYISNKSLIFIKFCNDLDGLGCVVVLVVVVVVGTIKGSFNRLATGGSSGEGSQVALASCWTVPASRVTCPDRTRHTPTHLFNT